MADLLKNREAAIMDEDDDSEDGEKQLSQQQRDLRSELQHTRQTYVVPDRSVGHELTE